MKIKVTKNNRKYNAVFYDSNDVIIRIDKKINSSLDLVNISKELIISNYDFEIKK